MCACTYAYVHVCVSEEDRQQEDGIPSKENKSRSPVEFQVRLDELYRVFLKDFMNQV